MTVTLRQGPDPANNPFDPTAASTVPVIGVDGLSFVLARPDVRFTFGLYPDKAVELAHKLLTLAHEAGAEIAE